MSGRCPICGKAYTIAKLDDLPSFPFCSDRCKLVDLGRWIDGDYAIPGPATPPPTEPAPGAPPAGDEVDD